MIYDMYDMFEKRSLCRNHHRPVDLLPYKPEADHLHDDRCNPGNRIRKKQESQRSVGREQSIDPDNPYSYSTDDGRIIGTVEYPIPLSAPGNRSIRFRRGNR